MKLKALAHMSGPFGRREIGAEFEVEDSVAAGLIARGIAEELPAVTPAKASKDKATSGEA